MNCIIYINYRDNTVVILNYDSNQGVLTHSKQINIEEPTIPKLILYRSNLVNYLSLIHK
jgi:hypothetical protein